MHYRQTLDDSQCQWLYNVAPCCGLSFLCKVFLSIFFTYVAMGMAFFGREVESFATFDRACLALLEALSLACHNNQGISRLSKFVLLSSTVGMKRAGEVPEVGTCLVAEGHV